MSDDPKLQQLAQYTPEQELSPGYGSHYLFFVGRDDVHGILLHLLNQEKLGLDINMFGFDDEELNAAIMDRLASKACAVQITLDSSQAGGVHERKILALDAMKDPPGFMNSFAVGQSATHQISHSKTGICVGQGIAFEGSTNWSGSGEGTGISLRSDVKNPAGFVAQNNTLVVSTSPPFISRLQLQLRAEHQVAQLQMLAKQKKAK